MNKPDETARVRVIPAYGTVEIDAVVARAVVAGSGGRCYIVAGMVFIARRPRTDHTSWQFSLSHWGRPPVVVSMHRLRRDGEAQMRHVYHAAVERDLRDDDAFAALTQELAAFSDGEAA